MEGIKIESGCIKIPNDKYGWIYRWQDKEGLHEVSFTAPIGVIPRIGDYIVGNEWVLGPRPQINNDQRMWIRRKHKSWDNYTWDE